MNAKNSHCMNRRLIISALIALAAFTASAQPYERALRRNFWNDGINVAGIRQDTLSISFAEAYARIKGGEYRHTWESDKSWGAGVEAATLMHLKNFSMIGSFSFEDVESSSACGSMFIHPDFYPFDVLEFTPGAKSLQAYSFSGGVSVDLSRSWRAGALIEFESSNYSKRKDLRHTNYRLDMTLAPGIQYHKGKFAVGANYIFSKNSETVDAEQIGTAVSSYEAFFDEGLGYGTRQLWTGTGVHLSEAGVSGLPVRENIHGASLQASYGKFYADARIRFRKGEAGEKQTIWYRFPGYDAAANIGFRTGAHQIRLSADFIRQDNSETVLDKETEGGITTTHEYGSNRIFSRSELGIRPEYRYDTDRWEVCAYFRYSYSSRLVSQMYPLLHYRLLSSFDGGASAICHLRAWDISLAAGWRQGICTERDRVASKTSGITSSPQRLGNWYDDELAYLTQPAASLAAGVRYNFKLGIYTGIGASWARNTVSGLNRYDASISVGYDF